MTKRRMSRRSLIGVLLLLSPLLYLTWDRFYGAYVVRQACARDGGVRIFARTHVNGFLNTISGPDGCMYCKEHLQSGEFESVDIYVASIAVYLTGRLEPGYYRLSLAPGGDQRCAWMNRVRNMRDRSFGTTEETTCIAADILSSRPVEPTFSEVNSSFNRAGRTINSTDWIVTASDQSQVLARARDYQFTSIVSRLLDESGGGGNSDAKCMTSKQIGDVLRNLPARVLRSRDDSDDA